MLETIMCNIFPINKQGRIQLLIATIKLVKEGRHQDLLLRRDH